MIPLILRLRKAIHREIAKAQDIIVETLYENFSSAVIHGGTAIWRCYKGNRFSEDIDVYIPREIQKLDSFFQSLEKKGFIIEKKKIGENSVFSSLRMNGILVRFEAIFKKISGSLKEYETAEGNFITIYTLTPEELIKEKISAYMNRLKIRDIYDIFFLIRYSNTALLQKDMDYFVKNFKKPIDEAELKVLILEGIVPSLNQMLSYIKTKVK